MDAQQSAVKPGERIPPRDPIEVLTEELKKTPMLSDFQKAMLACLRDFWTPHQLQIDGAEKAIEAIRTAAHKHGDKLREIREAIETAENSKSIKELLKIRQSLGYLEQIEQQRNRTIEATRALLEESRTTIKSEIAAAKEIDWLQINGSLEKYCREYVKDAMRPVLMKLEQLEDWLKRADAGFMGTTSRVDALERQRAATPVKKKPKPKRRR